MEQVFVVNPFSKSIKQKILCSKDCLCFDFERVKILKQSRKFSENCEAYLFLQLIFWRKQEKLKSIVCLEELLFFTIVRFTYLTYYYLFIRLELGIYNNMRHDDKKRVKSTLTGVIDNMDGIIWSRVSPDDIFVVVVVIVSHKVINIDSSLYVYFEESKRESQIYEQGDQKLTFCERCKHHLHDPEMEIQYVFVQKSRFQLENRQQILQNPQEVR